MLWDTQKYSLKSVYQGHEVGILSMSCSPNGQLLASASEDGEVVLWRIEQRSNQSAAELNLVEIQNIYGEHKEGVDSITFSSGSDKLIFSSKDSMIQVVDLKDNELERVLQGHTDKINYVCMNKEETLIASASADKTIKLWDA